MLKLTIATPGRCHRYGSGVFIINFKTYLGSFSSVSIVDFEQVNVN